MMENKTFGKWWNIVTWWCRCILWLVATISSRTLHKHNCCSQSRTFFKLNGALTLQKIISFQFTILVSKPRSPGKMVTLVANWIVMGAIFHLTHIFLYIYNININELYYFLYDKNEHTYTHTLWNGSKIMITCIECYACVRVHCLLLLQMKISSFGM